MDLVALRFRYYLVAMTLGVVASVHLNQAAGADSPTKPAAKPSAEATTGPAAAEKAEKGEKPERSLREQDIYIPYEKLRRVFEKHGRGVFLPYEQFEALWQAAQDKERPSAEPKPPLEALITETDSEATVSKDVVRVKAKVKIDLLTEGWHEIPLRLSDAAITSATLRGEPARIVADAKGGNRLLVEKKGKQPEHLELTLEYAKAIARAPGQNSVSFEAPQSPVGRWKVRIPQSGVKVNFQPLIAATEVPEESKGADAPVTGDKKPDAKIGDKKPDAKPDSAKPPEKSPQETVVLAFVGVAPTVRIDWTAKAEGAVGLAAVASVQAEQQVWLSEGVTRTRVSLLYKIDRAELSQLTLEVPTDCQVVNVVDDNVRQWSVQPAAGSPVQTIAVQLAEPAKGSQRVRVELEKLAGRSGPAPEKTAPAEKQPAGKRTAGTVQVPVIKALGAGRQQGLVLVQVASGLRAEVSRTQGVSQEDAARLSEVPGGSPGQQKWDFAYQYSAVPYLLELSVEEVQPRITAESLAEVRLEPERLSVDLTAAYTVEDAGVFKLEMDVPGDCDLRRVSGRVVAGTGASGRAEPAAVESYHLEGEGKDRRLIVNLTRKALGRIGLGVELQKDLRDENLLRPTNQASQIPLPLAQVALWTERAGGRVVVSAPESLEVDAGKAPGLRLISAKEALEGMSSGKPAASADEARPVLAFAFTQDQDPLTRRAKPVTLPLTAKRRKPQVTMRQLLVGRIEEGTIKYQATFQYSVLYSGVKTLRIDVPAEISSLLRNNTHSVHGKPLDPADEAAKGVDKGYVAWTFTGESELMGNGAIELVWEEETGKLGVGQSKDHSVRRLVPRPMERAGGELHAWGQVVLTKAETLDVLPKGEPQGLLPIDPQRDLATPVSGAARAFEFHGDDWELPVTITRYELEEVKRTSIERAVVRMVVTPADEIAVQAFYRMRSARQRLTVVLPDMAAFDTDPVRVNGQPVTLGRAQASEFLVPLLTTNSEEPFLLELRYVVPGNGQCLDLPAFPEDAAAQKVYVCAFVPETRSLLGTTGPWTEEFVWTHVGGLGWVPDPLLDAHGRPQDDKALARWVAEGVKLTGKPADSIPTDGQLFVFSSLRPAGPPDGSLYMTTVDRRLLSVAVFVLLIAAGVLLLRAGWAARILAVMALITLLVLAGVFLPTFSLQIFNGGFVWALWILVILWAAVFVLQLRPFAARVWQSMTRPRPTPQTAAPAPVPTAPQEGGPTHE